MGCDVWGLWRCVTQHADMIMMKLIVDDDGLCHVETNSCKASVLCSSMQCMILEALTSQSEVRVKPERSRNLRK